MVRSWIIISVFLFFLDEMMKWFALMRLPENGSRLDYAVGFALHKNYGIAFDIPMPQVVIIAITTLVIAGVIYLIVKNKNRPYLAIPLAFIAAGGVGNLFDRVVYGFTVDYFILFYRSAINMSDIMILGGVVALLISLSVVRKTSKFDERQKI